MKTIYITEAQKKRIKKAIAAQDQVGGKVNAGVMDAVAYGGGMCESSNNNKISKWYRGYNSKYGSKRNFLLWLTDDVDYARVYGNRIEEVVVDGTKTNPASIGDLEGIGEEIEEWFDYLEGPSDELANEMLKRGYNCYYFYANDDASYCMCLWDNAPIISRRELSKKEFENIEGYEGYNLKGYDDINENVEEDEYELGAENGMAPYYHVNESSEEIITLYHGVNRKGFEFNIEHGGFVPRVCSEGGPKAVWLSENQYNYEFTFAFDIPKHLVEQLSNVDYVYGNKIGFEDFNCRLIKTSISVFLDSDIVVEVNILDDRLSKIHFKYFPDLAMALLKDYKNFPIILEEYIKPYIEKYQNLKETIIKESPDTVWSMGLGFCDEEAIPFMFYNKDQGFYIGENGQKHIDMLLELGITQDDVNAIRNTDNAFCKFVDLERTGRYWPSANIISFWKTPIKNNQKLISSVNKLSQYVDIKYLVVDYWDGARDMLIPYRWFMNGTYDMLTYMGILDINPNYEKQYVESKKYTSFYVITQKNGTNTLDIDGNFIENKYAYYVTENVELEDKWNGEGERLEQLKKIKNVPPILYHSSYRKNRESIIKNGIYASVGDEYKDWWSYDGPNGEIPDDDELEHLVFLTTRPNTWSDNFMVEMDIYQIDTEQLDDTCFYLDPDKYMAKRGSICYAGNIPPSAIKLYHTKHGGKSISENVESEIVNPEDVDLSSFNIKKKLNPKFWKNGVLDSRIRLKLLDIADDFIEFLNIDWAKPEDITMTGSLANFNWDENYSDIDLHIIMDYSDVDERIDFVSNYFYSQKKLWNEEHSNINIMGFPVEVFVQDVNERHDSSGIYSLEKNKWLIEPEREKLASSKVNKAFIKDKVSEHMNAIDKLEFLFNKAKDDEYRLRRVMEKSNNLFGKIKFERKMGFKKSGGKEINNYNIVFKALRRNGYIEKLVNIKSMAYDKLNSLR